MNDEIVEDRETVVEGPVWSPAQIIGLIIGIGFTVLGIVAVSKTGFHPNHIYTPRTHVLTLPHSPLLGMIEIGFGVLTILASVVPGAARVAMTILGVAALVFGIVLLAKGWESDLTRWLAVTRRNGLLFVFAGAVLVLAAWLSPVFVPRTRRRHSRRVESPPV